MWINNCVGGQNYSLFFAMIVCTFIQLVVFIVGIGMLTGERNFGDFLAGFIFSWISGAVNCVFAFLLLNLIVLHIYLMCKGMSTYEFIVATRN